jgi:hypothetical protein
MPAGLSIRGHINRGDMLMSMKRMILAAFAVTLMGSAGVLAQGNPTGPMSFFVTSTSQGGNLGGLVGADATCQRLGAAAGQGNRTWRAYLSTQGQGAVNARDRIGNGPWFNAKGVRIAANLADLHGDVERDRNLLQIETALTEKGESIPGRGAPVNEHDILTGSDSHGKAFPAGEDRTCANWTSNADTNKAMIGHHDRMSAANTSWNSSHMTQGCSLDALKRTGGAGRFYCFAAN